MDDTYIGKEKYKEMVKETAPKSKTTANSFRAFIVGGGICVIGQIIHNLCLSAGAGRDSAGTYTAVVLIFLGCLLTGLGIYDKIGKFAGAGSVVPITGFANSVSAPAIEFKKEGYVLGVGAKIFVVAGPVIVYGTISSIIVGLIYYFTR
ncbi:stage V sporulation protein AC [Clostridia bacterium]|nr:stage V sporulation protein AC [Clostridia bacterium]